MFYNFWMCVGVSRVISLIALDQNLVMWKKLVNKLII